MFETVGDKTVLDAGVAAHEVVTGFLDGFTRSSSALITQFFSEVHVLIDRVGSAQVQVSIGGLTAAAKFVIPRKEV